MEPLVTIGITCYNAADTIARAIESANDQDYRNCEILVVDDYSQDNSAEIAASCANVRLIRHEKNMGVAAARNTIIAEARGQFIAFFDDDDISMRNRVSVQMNSIFDYERQSGAQLVSCWASGWKQYDNGYRAEFSAIGSRPKVPVGRDVVNYQLYMGRRDGVFFGGGTPSCSMMARRDVFVAAGGYDPVMKRIEDSDLSIRLGLAGCHFIGCPEQLVIQSASTGHDKRPEVGLQSELALIDKYRGEFNPPARYDYARKWATMKFHHFSGNRFKAMLVFAKLLICHPVWASKQFLRAAPARLRHEARMAK